MEDLIIRGGLVVDGSGAAGVRADVAVSGGRITGIGDYSGAAAGEILDAEGLAEFNKIDCMHLSRKGHSQLAAKLAELVPELVPEPLG